MEMWLGYLVGMALVALGSIWTYEPLARAESCMLYWLRKPVCVR